MIAVPELESEHECYPANTPITIAGQVTVKGADKEVIIILTLDSEGDGELVKKIATGEETYLVSDIIQAGKCLYHVSPLERP